MQEKIIVGSLVENVMIVVWILKFLVRVVFVTKTVWKI
tara:strand:+ start:485 stop:598 length:114 start_codon:yes stop_codon:yes gene_type:complete